MGPELAWNREQTELQVTPHTGDIVSKESGKVGTIGFTRHLRAYSSNKHRFDLWSSSVQKKKGYKPKWLWITLSGKKKKEQYDFFFSHEKMPQIKIKKVATFISEDKFSFSATSWIISLSTICTRQSPLIVCRKRSYGLASLLVVLSSNHFHKIKAGKVLFGKDVNERSWELICGKVEALYETGLLHVISCAFNVLIFYWEKLPKKYFLAAIEKNVKELLNLLD